MKGKPTLLPVIFMLINHKTKEVCLMHSSTETADHVVGLSIKLIHITK
jgi:hypothetical protein